MLAYLHSAIRSGYGSLRDFVPDLGEVGHWHLARGCLLAGARQERQASRGVSPSAKVAAIRGRFG